MTNIALFSARCCSCQHDFEIPHLGDFAYGEFVLTQERGLAFATLSAFTEPAFERIRAALRRVVPESAATYSRSCDRFHYVVARCASPVLGHGLLPQWVCPQCFSRNISLNDSLPTRTAPVPAASFAEFLALPPAGQSASLQQLWTESENFVAEQPTIAQVELTPPRPT